MPRPREQPPDHLEEVLLTILRSEREKGWAELTLEQIHHKMMNASSLSLAELETGIREILKGGRIRERTEHHYRLAD